VAKVKWKGGNWLAELRETNGFKYRQQAKGGNQPPASNWGERTGDGIRVSEKEIDRLLENKGIKMGGGRIWSISVGILDLIRG